MGNPVLRQNTFSQYNDNDLGSNAVMTASGTLLKTCTLGLLLAMTFAYTWYLQMAGFSDKAFMLMNVGLWGGLISVLFICFGPKNGLLPFTTSLYAMFEGLLLGGISAVANKIYPGVVPQAMLGTIFAIFGMYFLYSTKLVQCTNTFRKVVYISTFSIFGIYLTQFILSLFHASIPGLFSNGLIGIGFSVIVVAVASLNLILDFDFINRFSGNAPKILEWYGGFSLMVTIVWLYIEILNLLMKLQSRN